MAKKRIAVCFDGTWNTPDEPDEIGFAGGADGTFETVNPDAGVETNVCRLYRSIVKGVSDDGVEQIKWYDQGVGTKWYERIRGGAFGHGLSENIREGYKFLVDKHDDGDEVFVLGFSRGAYTARSLVGLIRNAGLLPHGSNEDQIDRAYELYRTRDDSADSEMAQRFRRQERTRIIPIHFLGVWDTVGALGIPVRAFGSINTELFKFHDTELSGIVKNAFQALAVDEHREPYQATLWDPKTKPGQTMEQRWFIGAHSDVGGGYEDRALSDVTLRWIQEKAKDCGLKLDPKGLPNIEDKNALSSFTDSFGNFLRGLYGLFNQRYYRPVCRTEFGNEDVDTTVRSRVQGDLTYRPRNPGLKEWLAK
jgi:uncharacterized protein (DUF2235 family)